jgi:CDP-glycerol glycerophosphotransferase (TagB/SpsB family)
VQLQGFDIVAIRGFVEELLVEHDPEYMHTHAHTYTHTHTHMHSRRYHWSERFRASRTSNEARQILFNQLTNKIRRSVGSKAVAMGANAVVTF